MKIFVIVSDYGYDGYSKPECVFSSMEKAKAEAARLDEGESPCREIFELELDAPRQPA